jgi:hypothetical protein
MVIGAFCQSEFEQWIFLAPKTTVVRRQTMEARMYRSIVLRQQEIAQPKFINKKRRVMMKTTFMFVVAMAMLLTHGLVFAQDTTLTITNTGNVGIGTTNPQGLFHVQPSVTAPGFLVKSDGSVSIGTTSGGNQKLRIETGSGNTGLSITNNSNGQTAIRIDNQASANRPLFVQNASTSGVLFGNSGNSPYAVSIDDIGSGDALTISNQNGGRGLYVVNSGGGEAARFAGSSANVVIVGNLDVGGTLTKGGGTFVIDHPLDPGNMILRHSFVESPDMMNIYNGNVTTDVDGFAIVQLPEYCEALNRDFRYQLTAIGQFAQPIVVREIEDNRFTIQTDKPSVKVSWQVTGVRKDPWAEKNRVVVEELKPLQSQGSYIHPEVYGLPNQSANLANHTVTRTEGMQK